jgi:hypothetical protein
MIGLSQLGRSHIAHQVINQQYARNRMGLWVSLPNVTQGRDPQKTFIHISQS